MTKKDSTLKHFIGICLIALVLLMLPSCGSSRSPVDRLVAKYGNVPEFSVILEDMDISGSMFPQYYHKYRVIIGDKIYYTDWEKVSESYFRQNENYLGMALISKTEDNNVTKTPIPPGYQYVGNSRYGEWQTDNSGNSFWAFYGQYMFMTSMFNMFSSPVYRSNYNTYTQYRDSGRPFYGTENQYGTNGSMTKNTNKNFFQRKMAKQQMRQTSFSDKVKQRINRSQNTFHSRGGGFGK